MSINFPGTANWEVDVGNPVSLQLTGACTIMGWVYNHVAVQNSDIISKQIGADRGYTLQAINGAVDTRVKFLIATSASTTKDSGLPAPPLDINKWYHVAGQFVPSTAVQIWQNGILENEDTTSVPATMYDSGNTVVIGGRPDPNGNFNGIIDDVRIYNRNLSAAEIATIFASRGRDQILDGLVSCWLMDEGAPGVVATGAGSIKDLGVNRNNGTPAGTITYQPNSF
jgi:hypothetical protein